MLPRASRLDCAPGTRPELSKSLQILLLCALLLSFAILFAILGGGGGSTPGTSDGSVAVEPSVPTPTGDSRPDLGESDELLSVTVTIEERARILSQDVDGILARLHRGEERIDIAAELLDIERGSGGKRGRHLVRFRLADGSSCCRDVVLRDDATVELGYGPRRLVAGRVLDPNREPIADAWVWAGEIAADGTLSTVRTDGEGKFELDVPAGEGIPLAIRAPGCASILRRIEVGSDGVAGLTAHLDAAQRVELVFGGVVDDPRAARFRLGAARVDTQLLDYPFFLRSLEHRDGFDSTGRAVLDDLPADCAIAVTAFHPAALQTSPSAIVTTRRGQKPVVLAMTPSRTVRGRVVDALGGAAVGVEVGIDEGEPAVTDSRGSFAVAWDGDPKSLLRARPKLGLGVVIQLGAGLIPTEVVLPPTDRVVGGRPTLLLFAPLRSERWRARLEGHSWQEAAPGRACELALAAPAIVDLRFTLYRGSSGQPAERRLENVVVAGPTELRVPD